MWVQIGKRQPCLDGLSLERHSLWGGEILKGTCDDRDQICFCCPCTHPAWYVNEDIDLGAVTKKTNIAEVEVSLSHIKAQLAWCGPLSFVATLISWCQLSPWCCRLGPRSAYRRVLGGSAVMQPLQASASPATRSKAGMALQGCPKQE